MNELLDNLSIRVLSARYAVPLTAAVLCGATDLWRFRVYNFLTVPLLLSGFGFHLLAPAGAHLGFPVVGAALGATLLLPFCALGGVGAGDVKLLAGIGAWIGAYDVLVLFVVTGLLVGGYSVCALAATGDWRNLPHKLQRASGETGSKEQLFRQREHVDDIAEQDSQTRRRRLVPMAALMAAALVILGIIQTFRGST